MPSSREPPLSPLAAPASLRSIYLLAVALTAAQAGAFWLSLRGQAPVGFAFGLLDLQPLQALVVALLLLAARDAAWGRRWRAALLAIGREVTLYMCWLYALVKCVAHYVIEDPREPTVQTADLPFWAGCALFVAGPYVLSRHLLRLVRRREEEEQREALLEDATAEEASAPDFNSATVSKLLRLATPQWRLMLVAFFFLGIAAVSQALVPRYISQVVREIIREEEGTAEAGSYFWPLKMMIISAVICGFASSCRGATFQIIGARVNMHLRRSLFEAILSQEIGFFDVTKSGDLTSRMTQDVQKVTDQITLNINVFARTLINIVTTLIFMFCMCPRLTFVAFCAVPVGVVLCKKYSAFLGVLSKDIQQGLADANAVATESVGCMTTIRSFAAEDMEVARFQSKLDLVYAKQKKLSSVYVFYLSTVIIIPNLVAALILWYGGRLSSLGLLHSGDLLAFVLYLSMMNDATSLLGDIYSSIMQALGAAEKVFQLLERKPQMRRDPVHPTALAAVRGEVVLSDVDLSYPSRPERPVLHSMAFRAAAGQTLALVGPSGGGKSSCIGLLQRWYAPAGGRVLLDGVPVDEIAHKELHRTVSIVGQEPVLFARTIRENILFGLVNPGDPVPAALENRMVEACRLANAHDFVTRLPLAYDTEVGERGVQLSGGQKQRVAIARALVRQPKVLLLDEATSALDSESEKQVQETIDRMMAGGQMTVIVIAHRLSTVRHADQICVVRDGQVVEVGRHEELVAKGGDYFSLVRHQLRDDSGDGKASADSLSDQIV